MVAVILAISALLVFCIGVRSFVLLKAAYEPTDRERSDAFYTSITLLFSTVPRGREFRRLQRRTIGLLCLSMLLLYLAQLVLHQSEPWLR
ncbi:MAG TPA: hypothetical protein DDW52_06965 [Planctomycetaceae bacterium]|nr:hypothetical protein [Planctomycetaceae bacterium]